MMEDPKHVLQPKKFNVLPDKMADDSFCLPLSPIHMHEMSVSADPYDLYMTRISTMRQAHKIMNEPVQN